MMKNSNLTIQVENFDFHGYKEYEGAVKNLERRYYESFSEAQKKRLKTAIWLKESVKFVREKD